MPEADSVAYTLDVPGARLYYERRGTDPLLLLIGSRWTAPASRPRRYLGVSRQLPASSRMASASSRSRPLLIAANGRSPDRESGSS